MQITFVWTCVAVLCLSAQVRARPDVQVDLNHPQPRLLTGSEFQSELQHATSAAWDHVPLRDILRRISTDQNIAILLDRRIDPDQEVNLQIDNLTVQNTVTQVARSGAATVSVLKNSLYVGPPSAAAVLRTLVELRTGELFAQQAALPKRRYFDLCQRHTVHWNDLDQPSDLIQSVAQRYHLQLEGLEQIPHDLWAGVTLPETNCVEALSIILIQFHRTFVWTDNAKGVAIVPIPKTVAIEKTYSLPTADPQKTTQQLRDTMPGIQIQIQQEQLIVRGTVEQQELVDRIVHPPRAMSTQKPPSARENPTPPLSRRLFTLRVENVPVAELMKKLKATGILFRFDPQTLVAAGIDLSTRISMDVHQAPASQFFENMFKPIGVSCTIDDHTVTLKPK